MIYPPRYLLEPRKRIVYTNAYDCIHFKYKKETFNLKAFDVTQDEFEEIWANALKDYFGHSRYCYVADYCPAN